MINSKFFFFKMSYLALHITFFYLLGEAFTAVKSLKLAEIDLNFLRQFIKVFHVTHKMLQIK